MILALSSMDPVVQGILFLVAVVCFLIVAWLEKSLVALGWAAFAFVFMWQAFAAAG